MLSNRSRVTLMSYTDHSAQRRFKSNTPSVYMDYKHFEYPPEMVNYLSIDSFQHAVLLIWELNKMLVYFFKINNLGTFLVHCLISSGQFDP